MIWDLCFTFMIAFPGESDGYIRDPHFSCHVHGSCPPHPGNNRAGNFPAGKPVGISIENDRESSPGK